MQAHPPLHLSLLGGAGEVAWCGGGGKVKECAGGGGDGDGVVAGHVGWVEVRDGVHADAVALPDLPADDGDLHRSLSRWAEAPQHCGWVMAEQRPAAGREGGGHRARVLHLQRPDEVHAAMQPPQPPARDSMLDPACGQAQPRELFPRDHTVLPARERRHGPLRLLRSHYFGLDLSRPRQTDETRPGDTKRRSSLRGRPETDETRPPSGHPSPAAVRRLPPQTRHRDGSDQAHFPAVA